MERQVDFKWAKKTVVLKIVSLFFQEKLNLIKIKVIWYTQTRIYEFRSKVDKISETIIRAENRQHQTALIKTWCKKMQNPTRNSPLSLTTDPFQLRRTNPISCEIHFNVFIELHTSIIVFVCIEMVLFVVCNVCSWCCETWHELCSFILYKLGFNLYWFAHLHQD